MLLVIATVLAVSIQPFYGVAHAQEAAASDEASRVVINEIAPATGTAEKWIELYNPTDEQVNIRDWRFERGASALSPVISHGKDLYVEPKGFYTYFTTNSLPLNGRELALTLKTGPSGETVDEVSYEVTAKDESYARVYDAADVWAIQTLPTPGVTNGAAPEPAVEPSIQVNDFATTNDQFKGIIVRFTAEDFQDVTDMIVTIERQEGDPVTKVATDKLVDALNNADGDVELTARFVVQSGEYAEEDDIDQWQVSSGGMWTKESHPLRAIVTITMKDGSDMVIKHDIFNETDDVTYESLLPRTAIITPVVPNNPEVSSDEQPREEEKIELVELGPIFIAPPVAPSRVNQPQFTRSVFGPSVDDSVAVLDGRGADEDREVLGTQTELPGIVAQAPTDAPMEATTDGWKIFGIMWYWWAVLLGAIAAIWALLSARRQRNAIL